MAVLSDNVTTISLSEILGYYINHAVVINKNPVLLTFSGVLGHFTSLASAGYGFSFMFLEGVGGFLEVALDGDGEGFCF